MKLVSANGLLVERVALDGIFREAAAGEGLVGYDGEDLRFDRGRFGVGPIDNEWEDDGRD